MFLCTLWSEQETMGQSGGKEDFCYTEKFALGGITKLSSYFWRLRESPPLVRSGTRMNWIKSLCSSKGSAFLKQATTECTSLPVFLDRLLPCSIVTSCNRCSSSLHSKYFCYHTVSFKMLLFTIKKIYHSHKEFMAVSAWISLTLYSLPKEM